MGLNLNQNGTAAADQQKAETAAKENAAVNQTAASGEAAAGIEKAIETADTANPLTPTIDGNDAPNNAGGLDSTTAVVEGETVEGDKVAVEVDLATVQSGVLATYSSSPISNYSVGRFQFENGLLTFKDDDREDLEEFEAIINGKNFPIIERNRLVKIDVAAAERLIADARRTQGGATQAIDSTVGERVNKPKAEGDLGTTSGRGN